MRRVLAVVAAAAMVAGSLALRSRLDEREDERSQVLRLTCATELEAACRRLESGDARLEVTVEPAGTTAARLAGVEGDTRLDGWLTTGPWPEIVDIHRQGAALEPLFTGPRSPLARSPLVLVVAKERAAVLAPRCAGGTVGWKCLGEAAANPGGWAALGRPEWGDVKPAHASPVSDAVGALVLGQAVSSWFESADLSTANLEDEAFQRWFAGLERAVARSPASPLTALLLTGPAAVDAVGTTEAEAGPALASAAPARRDPLTLLYPSPMATADVVLATPATGGPSGSLSRLVEGDDGREALAAAGWRVEGQRRAPGVPDTPGLGPGSGLPSSGLLAALQDRWSEVTGR